MQSGDRAPWAGGRQPLGKSGYLAKTTCRSSDNSDQKERKRMYHAEKRFILASASPRRRALLENMGLKFAVFAADIDETPRPQEEPCMYAARMAREKAMAAMAKFPRQYILSADTVVYRRSTIFDKPASSTDAVRILMQLRGGIHRVATAFAVGQPDGSMYEEIVITRVGFDDFSEQVAIAYAETGEPDDKAGAYGIQGKGGVLVKELRGSYSNVVGLPLCQVLAVLSKYGIVKTN